MIRGVAETNAKVTVRQGQSVLYEATVAPGPFSIDDLYDSGYSGDIEVTVTEADGRQRSFVVPYASVAQLLRPGVSRFSVTAGEYRDRSLDASPKFVMGTYQRGVTNAFTGYLGSIVAERYMAAQGGVAISTELGAVAFDVTRSHVAERPSPTPPPGAAKATGSPSASYWTAPRPTSPWLPTASPARDISSSATTRSPSATRKAASTASAADCRPTSASPWGELRQPLPERVGTELLERRAAQRHDLPGRLPNGFSWGTMSTSAGRTRMGSGYENQYLLSFSVPLGRDVRSPFLSSSVSYAGKRSNTQASLSGVAGERSQMNYSLYGSRSSDQGDRSSSAGGSVHYFAPAASLNASYSEGTGYRQQSVGIGGSLVAHPGGINFTQSQSETYAVVEAKGRKGPMSATT